MSLFFFCVFFVESPLLSPKNTRGRNGTLKALALGGTSWASTHGKVGDEEGCVEMELEPNP